MYKVFGILKRPQGMAFESFKQWWLTEHAPKVRQWPGLIEYRINMSTSPDQDFDGVAEVWFATKEAMDGVFATQAGQLARASALAGAGSLHVLHTEEHIIV
jgi:uncharacterized protein (TIGR02118 family)